ncbi:MAG: hypothetical protein ABIJ25_00140 [Pseudomonadota bacterium]
MGRPKGSKNRSTIAREREQMEELKNPTGQSGPKGEPDPEALKAIEAANRLPEGAVVVEEAEAQPKEEPKALPANGDLAALLKLMTQPDVAAAVVAAASQSPQGRAMLGIPADRAQASGEGRMDYKRPALRVMGGVEVEHDPSFQPHPPGYIKMYVRADGALTDYPGPHYELRKTTVARKDDQGRQIVVNGEAAYEERAVKALIDPGAAQDSAGRPIKSEVYKKWLDLWYECRGRRMGSNVVSEPSATTTTGAPAVALTADESPIVRA